MDFKSIWKKTLAQIEIKLDSPAHFRTWFRDTRLIEVQGKKAIIGVKNSYTADWLYKKHKNLVAKTLSFVYCLNLVPKFVYDKEIADTAQKREVIEEGMQDPILQVKDGIDPQTNQRIKQANLNDRYTFTTYVVGPSNQMGNAAALAVAE